MPVMVSRWQRFGSLGLAFAAGVLTTVVVVAVAASEPDPGSSGQAAPDATSSASPIVSGAASSPSPLLKIGGAPGAEPERTVDPLLLPYPFLSPTPPPSTRTVLDGTYLRVLTLRDVGGARVGLPFRCLRCPPYRIDAGVSTIMFWHGAWFLHHQMSDFKTQGSFVVEGDRVTLFKRPELSARGGRLPVREDRARSASKRSTTTVRGAASAPMTSCACSGRTSTCASGGSRTCGRARSPADLGGGVSLRGQSTRSAITTSRVDAEKRGLQVVRTRLGSSV